MLGGCTLLHAALIDLKVCTILFLYTNWSNGKLRRDNGNLEFALLQFMFGKGNKSDGTETFEWHAFTVNL